MVKRERACLGPFSGKMNRSAQAGAHCRSLTGAAVRLSARRGAFPGVARMGGNVPAVLVCDCQATSELRIFRRSSYSQRERPKYIALKKFSLIFFAILQYGY